LLTTTSGISPPPRKLNLPEHSMATILVCSTPIHGHVRPLLTIAQDLSERGHVVHMLTGSRFAGSIEGAGIAFHPLPAEADYDDRDMNAAFPGRAGLKGTALSKFEIDHAFVRPLAVQYREVQRLVAELRPAAIMNDSFFIGTLPYILIDAPDRPRVVGVGISPISQFSADAPPGGMGLTPLNGPANTIRNRLMNAAGQHIVFRATQQRANQLLKEVGSPPSPDFIFNCVARLDRLYQLSVPALEYPRRDLSKNTRFVGPLPAASRPDAPLPSWWNELGRGKPVVHVTQGTLANTDLTSLVIPTLQALAAFDGLIVTSTGGRPVEDLGTLPANARAAEFLPYDRFLPKVSIAITNGGYGGLHQMLAEGIPVIVAGDTEEKPDIAARVAWSGVGINLKTGRPSQEAIRAAVAEIQQDPSYRIRAREIAADIAATHALDTIGNDLAALIARDGAPS
jgi:MGT family glycosyltransferase